jgi:hypothetical protein
VAGILGMLVLWLGLLLLWLLVLISSPRKRLPDIGNKEIKQ